MSKHVYDTELSDYPIQPVAVILRNYSGEEIPVVGKITVPVKYENQEHILDLIVVEGNLPALFGRDWFSRIRVDWKNVFNVTTVFVDTRLWKTKHRGKRFQNFRHSYVLLTYRIEIHQSQPARMT